MRHDAHMSEPGAANPAKPNDAMGSAGADEVTYVAFHPRWLRRAMLVVIGAVLLWQVINWSWGHLAGFLFDILLAWLAAISFDPVVTWLSRRGMRRGLATAIVGASLLVITLLFMASFGAVLLQQAADLIVALPLLITQAFAWVNGTFHTTFDAGTVMEGITISPQQALGYLQTYGGGIFGFLTGFMVLVFRGVTVLVFAFYFSADAPRIKRWIARWLPAERQLVFLNVWDISVQKAGGFVISKLALAAISSAAHVLFFWLIGVPYWLPMGIFAGLTSQFIPTFGTYLGVIVPGFFAAFREPLDIVWIVLFAVVFQQIESYVLTPKIARQTMDINSGVALASVFIGYALFGPMGAIIGIPLAAIVIAILETYGRRHDLHPQVEEQTAPPARRPRLTRRKRSALADDGTTQAQSGGA